MFMCIYVNLGQQIFFYGIKRRNFQVSKGPGNECSEADSFLGTNVPWNECSREHSFPGTFIPGYGLENESSITGTKSLGNE